MFYCVSVMSIYLYFFCLIPTVTFCDGTQNSLSTTGSAENQFNLMKDRYTGCEIVMGNLEISMMEHTRDFSFLQVKLWPHCGVTDGEQQHGCQRTTACVSVRTGNLSRQERKKKKSKTKLLSLFTADHVTV